MVRLDLVPSLIRKSSNYAWTVGVAGTLAAVLLTDTAHAQNLPNAFGNILNGVIQQQQLQQQQLQQQQLQQQRQQQQYQQQLQQQQLQQQYQQQQEDARQRAIEQQRQQSAAASAARQGAIQQLRDALSAIGALGASPKDLTVLIVAHDSPRVTRNLAGDASFARPAVACYPFGRASDSSKANDPNLPDAAFLSDAVERIKAKGGGNLLFNDCGRGGFGNVDILVFTIQQLDAPGVGADQIKRELSG